MDRLLSKMGFRKRPEQKDSDPGRSEQARSEDIKTIKASGLFDPAFYQARAGLRFHDPILHYLTEGEARDIAPSELFDPLFYRLTNPDVVQAGCGLLLHYIRNGRKEGRYPHRRALREDAE